MLGLEGLLLGVGTIAVQPVADFVELGLDLGALSVSRCRDKAFFLEEIARAVSVSLQLVERGLTGEAGLVRSVESSKAVIN